MSNLIAKLPFGELRTFDDNEIWIRGLGKSDPGKVRVSIPRALIESNLGGFSFNIERDDGKMELDEMAYVMGRMTADKTGGALYFAVAPAIGQPCREVLYVDTGAMVVHPRIMALGGMDGIPAPGRVTRFYTDGGKFCANWQDDTGQPTGIVYATHGSTDERQWTAVGKVRIDPL